MYIYTIYYILCTILCNLLLFPLTSSYCRPIIAANQKRLASAEDYLFSGSHDDSLISYIGSTTSATTTTNTTATASTTAIAADPLSYLIDFREHDVPYTVRVSIDLNLRIGAWYTITPEYTTETCLIQIEKEIIELCEPRILAFDIECEKSPLKFPNAEVDRIFMISYMVKGQGFLIINRYNIVFSCFSMGFYVMVCIYCYICVWYILFYTLI